MPHFLKRSALQLMPHVPFFLLATLFSVLPLLLVIFSHGWPENHEYLQFFDRTLVWADHFKQGDFFPVWSSSDAYGYGAPLPLFYQKLFHVINALIFIALGSIKAATITTLFAFFMVGIYGLRFAMRYVAKSPAVYTVLPLALPLTSYTITDWFVRGAMAELTALMIVPWLLWWCMRLVKTGVVSYWIIGIFPALFYAHNAIALVSLIVVAASGLVVILQKSKAKQLIKSWKRIVLCLIGVSGLIVPSLVLQNAMGQDYNPAEKIDDTYNIAAGFQSPLAYLFDRDYVWLQHMEGVSVQIDFLLWVPILVLILFLLWRKVKSKQLVTPKDPVVWAVVLSLAAYSVLQLEVSRRIYDAIHVLSLIQFPWRMLAVITPLLLLLLGLLIDKLWKDTYQKSVLRAVLGLWLVLFAALSPLTYPNTVAKMDIRKTYPEKPLYAGGEYLPITYSTSGELLNNAQMIELYQNLQDTKDATVRDVSLRAEGVEKLFEISANRGGRVALPVSYSRFSQVFIDGKRVETFRDPHDPRLIIAVDKGTSAVRIELPTVGRIIKG